MPIIGIDLGTTFSAIACLDDIGNPEVLSNLDNNKITPSIVYVPSTGKVIVGDKARNAGKGDRNRVIKETKKRMSGDEVFDINIGDWIDGEADLKDKFNASDISSFILKKLKNYQSDIDEVVITIPALFADKARNNTELAAKKAGLKALELINEPTAAVLHYANLPGVSLSGKVLVFDLGGGTFDVSIAEVNGKKIEILHSSGDGNLGGTDFDKEVFNLINEKYKKEKNVQLDDKNDTYYEEAEKIKRILSVKKETTTVIDGTEGPVSVTITRDEFINSIKKYLDRISMHMDECLEKYNISDINETLLVGGSTRVPAVTDLVTKKMSKPPVKGVDVDEAVASGAAIYAGLLSKEKLNSAQKEAMEKIEVSDVTNHYLGTEALIPNETTNQYELKNSIIIERDTKLPCTNTKDYFTTAENQKSILIKVTQCHIYEESLDFVDIIGEYELMLPEGTPEGDKISTTYSYDSSGKMVCKSVHAASENTAEATFQVKTAYKSSEKEDDPFLDFDIDD